MLRGARFPCPCRAVFVIAVALAAVLRADPAAAQVTDDSAATAALPSCQCVCSENTGQTQDGGTPTTAVADDTEQTTDTGTDAAIADPADDGATPAGSRIVFSELLPDPEGKDTDGEFIEIHNDGNNDVSLAGWSIRSSSEKIFNLPDETMTAGSYRYFTYAETKIVLTNTGSGLTLVGPDGTAVEQVTYPGPAKTGQSYAKNDDGLWQWTPLLTPGRANEFPPAVTTGDASATTDQSTAATSTTDENTDTAATTETTGSATGTTATSAAATNEVEAATSATTPADDSAAPATTDAATSRVIISEFLPNPVGDDSTEWIELANTGDGDAALAGWSVDDDPGGSKPFVLTVTDVIPVGGFLLLPKSRTGLALNNDGDSVRLIDPTGVLVDAVAYAGVPEGKSYARTRAGWVWTEPPTPGSANEQEITYNQAENPVSGTVIPGADSDDGDSTPDEVIPTEIADLGGLDDGEEVTVRGVVNLPPGRLAKTLVSLQDAAGAAGIIVRLYGKTLPAMAVGEIWEITGKVGSASGEMRLNASAAAAMMIGEQTMNFLERTVADISADDNGVAVAVTGLVAGRGKNWLTVTDADGGHEIKVTLPKGALIGPAEVGSEMSARGVVRFHEDGSELVLMDRKDLKMTAPAATETAGAEAAGEAAKNAEPGRPPLVFNETPSRHLGGTMALAATLLAAAAAAGFFWWRRRQSCDSLAE